MEYSSSEDDELVVDSMDFEEVDRSGHFFFDDGENPVVVDVADDAAGNELLVSNADGRNIPQPFVGMEFESDTAARDFYHSYAHQHGFGIRVARSRCERRKGAEVLVMKRFVCLKEGHHKKKAPSSANGPQKKKRKRLSIRDGCLAMMEVARRSPDCWVVAKLVLDHTHVVVGPDRLSRIQLAHQENDGDYPKETRQRISGEDSHALFDYFKRKQTANPGFFYALQNDDRNFITCVFWADSRARAAFGDFGDAVSFDTSYRKNKHMMPFVAFTGVNHHGHPVNFGCALIMDRTEASLVWVFETWILAMFGRHPLSLTTDHDKAIVAAAMKVLSNTHHRFCRWRLLSRCKKMLSDVCSRFPTLYEDIKSCVNQSDTKEVFQHSWSSILDRYDLRENAWMLWLYNVRDKWVPAYLKGPFFAELYPAHRLETINKFFRKNFNAKVSLQIFIAKFDLAMDGWYEREVQEDYTIMHSKSMLKTDSPLEKQAAGIYTRVVFENFQMELIEAFDHFAVEFRDGTIVKYSVQKHGGSHIFEIVDFNGSGKKPICTCQKFESSGILCRHVLAVLLLGRLSYLPEEYILKRWTRNAKSGPQLDEQGMEMRNYCHGSPMLRYNDLFRDALKCAERASTCGDAYKAAKDMLQKAFAELVSSEENFRRNEQIFSEKNLEESSRR